MLFHVSEEPATERFEPRPIVTPKRSRPFDGSQTLAGSQAILLNTMIRLIGPGGAGKSSIGALLAERLKVPFLDLDQHFAGRVGDISEYIDRHGYDAYARENIEAYCSLFRGGIRRDVVALSSGFMTYAGDVHLEYGRVRREIEECARTFVLLPSLDRELCVAETVRRQVARPFGRSPEREEAVIRARFEVCKALPMRKVVTMRPAAAIVDEILAALSPANPQPIAGLAPSSERPPIPNPRSFLGG